MSKLYMGFDAGTQSVKVAVYDGLYVAHLDSGAVILYQSIGLKYVGAYLAAPFYLHVLTFDIFYFFKMLPLFYFNKL